MARLGVVAAAGRRRRAFAGPAAFLLVVTIAVVAIHSTRQHSSASSQASTPLVTSKHPVVIGHLSPFYRVRAGDTFATIAGKTGIPVARIRKLNPRIQPTALFIGEQIRIR